MSCQEDAAKSCCPEQKSRAEQVEAAEAQPPGHDHHSASESEPLRILEQFERLYQCRIAEVEADGRASDSQRTQLKLKIMTDWVKDLGEQNAMLVQTVRDLEVAAVCRVKLLENKLQVTSNLISHNMSHPDKSEEDLNMLSNRISHLVNNQDDMQQSINYLQSDIGSLLELIRRGRTENNWDLDGITFYEIQPSDIPVPENCTCDQIANVINNEESACDKRDLQIKKLSEQLHNTETKMEKLLHEHKCREDALESKVSEMCRESESLRKKLACLEKESSESHEALTIEVAQKYDDLLCLKDDIKHLEEQLHDSARKLHLKDEVIHQLREDIRKDNEKIYEKDIRIKALENHAEELRLQLLSNDDTINELRNNLKRAAEKVPATKRKVRISDDHCETANNSSQNISMENQNEILLYLMNLRASMEKDDEIIQSLKTEYETVLKSLNQTMTMYDRDVTLANEKLLDIENCLSNYRCEVIEQDFNKDSVKEFINNIEKKIIFVEKLFQTNCKKCVKENVQSEIKDVISRVTLGIQKLSEIHENKLCIASSIKAMISENKKSCHKNTMSEEEQKAIFAAISQQYRMMEEFRLCTVEVQAATEDLREEVSEVISNLNSRHCKYLELNKMVSQIQDCLTKTREDMSEVINQMEVQDEERLRHSERITNNRIRLKDIKNEFNRTQSELSKCVNNVHNNIEQNSLLGYTEINTCNDLLITVVEEVEQIVNNLQTFQTQGCCTSTVNKLKNQLVAMELNVKELKRKSERILKENEIAQKSFEEKSKRLEKYECEVDNCHSKMQDVLESIVAVQDQMNEFGCIQESENFYQSTNETIKLKEDLRRLHKKCEELKLKASQELLTDKKEVEVLEWENRIKDLQDQIQVLQNEIKYKQQTNIFLKQSVESIEKELISTRSKAEDNRRCSSLECLELKKKIVELENSLRVQKDIENNLKCLVNNETDSKKSQLLAKDRYYDSAIKSGLQGTNENISQLFKGLQDTIQTIKMGLQELTDKLKKLVPEGSSHACSPNMTVHAATEILAKYVEIIKYCFFEVEKIKAALNSKDKLMENMDKIIRIQKDSITISQSEVEDVHKTLQQKIEAQEKTIAQIEKEKRHLSKQIELQVQTIGHLQNAVVEAKRSIDQLSNKSASDNLNKSQIIKSLNLYLNETRSQYSDCYGEASEQDALLELQRDAISALKKRIDGLECDGFVHAFMLHFIYCVILFKYQEELNERNLQLTDMRSKIKELDYAKTYTERQCENFQCKYREVNKEMENLRCSFEDSRLKLLTEKESEMSVLSEENDNLKKQLESYKLDFNVIEEEMRRIGMVDHFSIESFRMALETLHADNEQFRCEVENYKKVIDEFKCSNKCLSSKLSDLQRAKDACVEKYKGRTMSLQGEILYKNEQIKHLQGELTKNEAMIGELLHVIEEVKEKLCRSDVRWKNCCSDLGSSKKTISAMQSHIDSLKLALQEKSDDFDKMRKDYQDLKSEYCIFKSRAEMNDEKLKNELSLLRHKFKQSQNELIEAQKAYDKVLQNLNKAKGQLVKMASERRIPDDYQQPNSATFNCDQSREDKSDDTKKLTKDLEDCREKLNSKSTALSELQTKYHAILNKCETFERNCQHQKNEIMLLEKKLACVNQKFQNCTEKNDELIRQNKSFEDSNNKCMAELEDIVLQLEDMQSSLVDLRTECDMKTQSLDCVSAELAKMKVSRSEVCEESKHVLNWLRRWMREQKQAAAELQEKLHDRQLRLARVSSEKKNFMNEMKRLKRTNRVLTKRLKLVRRSPAAVARPTAAAIVNGYSLPLSTSANKSPVKQRNNCPRNGFHSYPHKKESNAIYSYFKREFKETPNRSLNKITVQGDCKWFRTLEHLTKEVPRTSQIDESNKRSNRMIHEDTADCGYQTSSSK